MKDVYKMTVRFDLTDARERALAEYMQTLDVKKYQSRNQFTIDALAEYVDLQSITREQHEEDIEQVVMLELRRLAKYLESHEEEFAKLLAEKTNADMLAEQKALETELNRATARNEMLTSLFAKTYEDNVSGKLSDEMYMELSHKYEVERLELKTKIFEYKERLAKISEMEQNKDDFLKAVRKFMEMDSLTAPMLRELIDHIDVYEKEGGKKNYTQRIVIYYRFVGYLELPSSENENYKTNTRKGVDVEYIPTAKSA